MSGATVLETFSFAYNADGQLTSASNPDSAYAYARRLLKRREVRNEAQFDRRAKLRAILQ